MSKPTQQRRLKLLEDFAGLCGICGEPIDVNQGGPMRLTIDHIRPIARGGTNRYDNLQPAHYICNNEKGHGEQLEGERRKRRTAGATFSLPSEALETLGVLAATLPESA